MNNMAIMRATAVMGGSTVNVLGREAVLVLMDMMVASTSTGMVWSSMLACWGVQPL